MTVTPLLKLRVRAVTWEAEGILGFELVPLERGASLPPFEAGAHVDLHLPGGPIRSYSLVNASTERHRYCIAVNLDAASRGGSRQLHQSVRAGDVLEVGPPRNNFPLDEGAVGAGAPAVLIAGGIGITPILSMARRLAALGKPWRLHYAARRRAVAAFVDEIEALARSGGSAEFVFDQEPGGRMLDLPALVAAAGARSHLYCCGPLPMLDAFVKATAALARERVHLEHFAAREAPAVTGGFELKLARSGRTLAVPPGRGILDVLLDAGFDPPHACREGICGTCETAVLAGTPDHRDLVLSDADRAAGRTMMICCSGSKTASLTLDL